MSDRTPRELSQDPHAVYNREWARKNRERVNAQRRAAREANRDEYNRKRREYSREWKAKNREHVRAKGREYRRKFRKEQPERYIQQKREWTDKNRARINDQAKALRNLDPERVNRYKRESYQRSRQDPEWVAAMNADRAIRNAEWRKNNPEKSRQFSRTWRAKNPEKVRLRAARREARERGAERLVITVKDIRRILRAPCVYCGGVSTQMDHVIPLARGGRHSIGNLIGACQPCNLSKGALLVVEWRRRLARRTGPNSRT